MARLKPGFEKRDGLLVAAAAVLIAGYLGLGHFSVVGPAPWLEEKQAASQLAQRAMAAVGAERRARGLTIDDLRAALANQNQDTSGGDFWEGKRRYVVRTIGQFHSPEQVEGTIISRRDGKPVYVRDVARVQLGKKKADGVVRR